MLNAPGWMRDSTGFHLRREQGVSKGEQSNSRTSLGHATPTGLTPNWSLGVAWLLLHSWQSGMGTVGRPGQREHQGVVGTGMSLGWLAPLAQWLQLSRMRVMMGRMSGGAG